METYRAESVIVVHSKLDTTVTDFTDVVIVVAESIGFGHSHAQQNAGGGLFIPVESNIEFPDVSIQTNAPGGRFLPLQVFVHGVYGLGTVPVCASKDITVAERHGSNCGIVGAKVLIAEFAPRATDLGI